MTVARTVSLTETVIDEVPDFYVSRKLPAMLGHEPAGEAVEVGAGVTGVRPGVGVALHHHSPCGECRRCRRGHETLCGASAPRAWTPAASPVRPRPGGAGRRRDRVLPARGRDRRRGRRPRPRRRALRLRARRDRRGARGAAQR